MLTYKKKCAIRVRVRVLDKRRLPLTTDLVFGTEGYNITLEDPSLVPASPPPESHAPMGRDGTGDDKGGATEKDPESASNKLKSASTTPSSEKGSVQMERRFLVRHRCQWRTQVPNGVWAKSNTILFLSLTEENYDHGKLI
jgi:hypothetical protein